MRQLLIISILLTLVFGCSQTPQQKMEDLYGKGFSYIGKLELEKATAAFDELAALDSTDLRPLYGQARVFEARLMYYDALHLYLKIQQLDSAFAPAMAGAWRNYMQLDFPAEAARHAAVYRRINPEDWLGGQFLALAQLEDGQLEDARQTLAATTAPAEADGAVLKMIEARLYLLRGHADSAKAIYENAIPKAVESNVGLCQAANYLEEAGLIDSAMALSRRAVEKDGSQFSIAQKHFFRLLRHSYFWEARHTIAGLKERGIEDPVTRVMDLFYYRVIEDRLNLREVASVYRGAYPRNFSAAIYEMGARGEVGDQLSIFKDIPAMKRVARLTGVTPEFYDFYEYNLEHLHFEFDICPESVKRLNRLTSRMKDTRRMNLDITHGNYIITDHTGGLKKLSEITDRYQSDPLWLTEIGKVYSHIGVRRLDLAESVLQKVLEINPYYHAAFSRGVKMYMWQKQWRKALDWFKKYPVFEANYAELGLLKAKCLIFTGDLEQGIELFGKSLEGASGNLSVLDDILEKLLRIDQPDQAARLEQILLEHAGENPDAMSLLARFCADQKKYDASMDFAEKAVAAEPDNALGLIHKAWAVYKLGDKDKAIAMFEENSRKFPGNADNLYYYSRLMAIERISPNKAANLARESVFSGWGSPRYLLNLSYVYFLNGRYDLSRSEARKALFVEKTNPEVYFRMGIAMYKEGNPQAKETLRKSVELGLRGEDLKSAQDALKML